MTPLDPLEASGVLRLAGRRLTEAYHRQMRYLVNRLLGHGIVSGLDVDVVGGEVRVSPGVAMDRLGREPVGSWQPRMTADNPGQGVARIGHDYPNGRRASEQT